jgi:hypothetical protein
MVVPFINQTMLAPVEVFRQRMSGLPSLLKSPVPASVQTVEREGREAWDTTVVPFIYQIMLAPVEAFLQRMSGLPSLLKSPDVGEGEDLSVNAALTLVLEFIVIWQVVFVPEHAPDHPANVESALAVAVRVTAVPMLKVVPAGLEVTVPAPVPVLVILRVYVAAEKVAAIVRFAVTLENV